MKISLITVCFNSEAHIQRCLDSVSYQSSRVFEHIIIDGNSTDSTQALLEDYKRKDEGYHKKVISEPDDGVYDAMNKGLSMVRGDYAWFLNSDDRLADTDVVNDVKNAPYQNHPAMIAGTTRIMSESKVIRMYESKEKRTRYIPQLPHPSLLVAVDFLRAHEIDFDSGKTIASDYKMQLEVIKSGGDIHIEDRVFTDMYVGGISNSSLKYKIMGFLESIAVFNEVFGSGGMENAAWKTASKISQIINL